MPPPPITLELLPAGCGDSLLVSGPFGARTWRMLVDTGPDECYPQLQARLAALALSTNGRRFIDVFVVTHVDHGHIGGAGKLLGDTSLKLSFGDIWFNAPAARSRSDWGPGGCWPWHRCRRTGPSRGGCWRPADRTGRCGASRSRATTNTAGSRHRLSAQGRTLPATPLLRAVLDATSRTPEQ